MVPLIWAAVGGTLGLLILLGLQSLPVLVSWLHSWDLVGFCVPYQDLTQWHLGSSNKLTVATAGDFRPVSLLFPLKLPGREGDWSLRLVSGLLFG